MKEKTKIILILIIGIFFIGFGILAIYNAYFFSKNPSGVFWYCYISMIVIGISALFRNAWVIAAQVNLLGISLLMWNFDFFYHIVFGRSIFGLVNSFFNGGFSFGKVISMEHLFLIPLSILLIYLIKLKKDDFWKLSLVEIPMIFFITRAFTNPQKNINCVFESCFSFIGNYLFPLVWFTLAISIMVISTVIINNIEVFKNNNVYKNNLEEYKVKDKLSFAINEIIN